MAKITLNDVGSLLDATTAVVTMNNNSDRVETAFENTLSRDGTSPNTMHASLDMNSEHILNLPAPIGPASPLRLQDLSDFVGGGTVTNIPAGGTINQALVKNSNDDYDVHWQNTLNNFSSPNNTITTGPTTVDINLAHANTWTGAQTFGQAGSVGKFKLAGNTSGTLILDAAAAASGTMTVPAGTDTLVARTTTDTLTNKSISGATNTLTLIPVTALNSGTGASSSTYWRGDGTWAAAGGVSGAALTKTDDTNVTLTLGGAPTSALVNAASITVGWTGTLAATRGGTGTGSYAVGDILYASTTSALSKLADVATGNALISGGVSTAPSWGKITTSHISGTTGSGNFVLATSPTLVTPVLGVATATSLNSLTVTTSTGTLTIANGKTATFNNSVAFSGTDSTVMTFPATTGTVATLNTAQTFTSTQTFGNAVAANFTGTIQLNGNPALSSTTGSTPYVFFTNAAGNNVFIGGGGGGSPDNTNYYQNSSHAFRTTGATNQAAIDSNGATFASNTATPAGGSTGVGVKLGTTANFGIFYGSGAPTLSAGQGSLYIRSDGSSTSTRLYVNTNGTTGWTNATTAT